MNPQELINFRNEQNRSETELEFLAFILNGIRQAQKENNELVAQDTAQDIKRSEEEVERNDRAAEQREVHSSILSSILDEIHEKDIDLSGVIAGLESVRAEIEASRQEDKEEEPVEAERHSSVLQAISALLEATRENKPETIDISPVVDKTDEVSKKTHELLSSLIAEIAKIDVKPEVKIDIPKEVEVKEPKWYKPFSFDTKWLKPIEYAVNAINPKPALARLEELLEKIYKKPFPTIPKTKDGSRILVEVDRTGGGGSGVINVTGSPINPATEEKQDALIAQTLGDKPLSGASANGTVALTSANTWYAVPSGTPPATPYVLVTSLENAAGTVRFGFANTSTPSVTNGNLADGTITLRLAGGQVVYFGSSTAGDDVNFSTKII